MNVALVNRNTHKKPILNHFITKPQPTSSSLTESICLILSHGDLEVSLWVLTQIRMSSDE
jgi:hypothetical protein